MRCLRIDLQRRFSRYVNGELAIYDVKRIEDHLLDCLWCRAHLARLRAGHQFARQMPRVAVERDPWSAIEAAIEAEPQNSSINKFSQPRRGPAWRKRLLRPSLAAWVAVAGLSLLVLMLALNRQQPGGDADAAIDFGDFHPVAIADIERNTEPHVVAEGYVSEVRIDHEDGDLMFKLVDDITQAQPFIVCEIINPKKFSLPPVGSRVRVYGVSRYDSKVSHQWYEVHPVLNIEMVQY